jgi:hypothetical protein
MDIAKGGLAIADSKERQQTRVRKSIQIGSGSDRLERRREIAETMSFLR